ncbi:hypothetical protein JCM16303_002683 [Sporobolomyces ruberrimus]
MVLLTYTRALDTRLAPLLPLLPPELLQLVQFYSSSSSTRTTSNDDRSTENQYRLSSLLRLTEIVIIPLKPREKSPELLAILSSIQLTLDRESYSSLTSLQTPSYRSLLPLRDPHASSKGGGGGETLGQEWNQIKKELSAIVNVGFSMVAVFTGVWYVGFGYSQATRLGLSMGGAFLIAAIEGWLYYRVFSRIEEGKLEKEKWRDHSGPTGGGGGGGGTARGKVLKFD